MKSQVAKRINVNLTEREVYALKRLQDEMTTRGWKMSQSDIIREAIASYCTMNTGAILGSGHMEK